MAMSPMTASIMSAVPARRAGTGSAMNDATRELGAALGVAVLGSLAASRYGPIRSTGSSTRSLPNRNPPSGRRCRVRSSTPSHCRRPTRLPSPRSASHAFVDGIHFAVTVGAALAAIAAVVVYRYLPHEATHETPVESAEHMAELGVGVTRR